MTQATTFKVGDKVEHRTFGRGEIAFGPAEFSTTRAGYLLKNTDGVHKVVPSSEWMKLVPAFTAGDVARLFDEDVKVVSGPYTNRYHTWFVVDKDGVGETTASMDELKPFPTPEPVKVGDKMRVLVDGADGATVHAGDVLTVKRVFRDGAVRAVERAGEREWFISWSNFEKVTESAGSTTFTYDGVTYDLTAKYKDRDGDTWRFAQVEGTVRGRMGSGRIVSSDDALVEIVRSYGPLRKI